jgi:predicted amidohydrolase YtcJ
MLRGLCLALSSAATVLAAPADPPADVVLTGGTVVTLDPGRPRATAVAVRGGRIALVGSDAEVRALAGPRTERIDLAGRTVLPGLADAHVHVEGLGASLESLSLVGAARLDEALDRVRRAAAALAPGEWLLGRGWDQNDWPDQRFPTASALDAVSAGHPVYLTRVDGHAGWANTRAMELAGVTASTADPAGGRILRGDGGAPSGVFVDRAQALVTSKIPAPAREVRKRRLARGLRAAAEAGLTSVHDAGVGLDTVALYKELLAEDALPVRVYVMISGPEEFLKGGALLRPEIGLGDGRLTIRAVKVVADGALGSRGALLLEPYADEPGTRGLRTVDPARFRELLRQAVARGFQVNTHAIGDGANRFVLDAYAEALEGAAGGGAARRFRIEHAQVIAPEDAPRFKSIGVIPSVQPTHCTSDMYWATDRLGPERAKGAYLWQTFLRQGVVLAGGSDAPVESIAVLPGLYAAVTRQDAKGWPAGGWHPEERVGIEDAVRMFSAGAAWAAFEDKERGSVAPGRRADLTVLTRDVTAIPAADILKTEVALTIVGGRVVYDGREGANGTNRRGVSGGEPTHTSGMMRRVPPLRSTL